jgi:hypothetical protein
VLIVPGFIAFKILIKCEKEYKGWLKRASSGLSEKRDVCLGHPRPTKRDKEGEKRFISMGSEIYLPQESIKRILRAEKV